MLCGRVPKGSRRCERSGRVNDDSHSRTRSRPDQPRGGFGDGASEVQDSGNKAGSEEFGRWVDWELNGYPEGQPLPEYRRLPVQCYANFIDKGWRADRQPIQLDVLPKEVREALTHSEFRDGIAKASILVEHGTQIERSDLVPLLQGNMLPAMRCVRVWMALPENGFAELLGSVRTRALDFVLEIEGENPDAGEATPGSRPVPVERLGMLVRKHFGSVRTVVQPNKSESIPQIADGRVQP